MSPSGEGEAVVAGADGSVAFVEKVEGGGFAIGYAPFAGRRFGAPRVVVSDADVVPASLSLTGDTIGWRTAAGAQMSARVSAVAAAARQHGDDHRRAGEDRQRRGAETDEAGIDDQPVRRRSKVS